MPASRFSRRNKRSSLRGGCIVEMSLIMPWYFFLFVGTFDWGFYAHALVSVQAAARTAALYTSQTSGTSADQPNACKYVVNEMAVASNVSSSSNCTADPLVVSATKVNDVAGVSGQSASQVTVSYHTLNLIPIPGLLAQQFWISQTVTMRLRG